MRRLVVVSSARGLHVIRVMMFAAGLAGAMATAVWWLFQARADFAPLLALAAIPRYFALTFLPAAIVSFAMMPSIAQLGRRGWPDRDLELPPLFLFVMLSLCAFAALELPTLLTWGRENLEQVRRLNAWGPDPLGLHIVPIAFLVSMPLLPTAAMLSFALTAVIVIAGRPELTFRVLASCVAVQGGLVLGSYLFMDGIRDAGDAVLKVLASATESAERDAFTAQVVEWFGRQQALGGAVNRALIWVLGGYFLALVLSEFLVPGRAPATGDSGTATADTPVQGEAAGLHTTVVAVRAPSTASTAFDRSSYGVRPRMSLLQSVFWRPSTEYEIVSIPPARDARFSFSWNTGILRRERDGAPLLTIQTAGGLPWNPAYAVTDAASGAPLGILRRSGPDWEVVDAAGATIVRVLRAEARPGYVRYMASVPGREVCRFTWAMPALGVSSAELEIEFLPDAGPSFDRALALAIAPMLEEQARRWNYTANA